MTIGLKRAYEPAAECDGWRVLVDRVWPRGISKEALQIDAWRKDLAPSTELRRWFGHDPKKWDEFKKRYARELEQREDAPRSCSGRRGWAASPWCSAPRTPSATTPWP